MKTISGAPIQTSQGPGPITAFTGAPALGLVYITAAGVVGVNVNVTLTAAGDLTAAGIVRVGNGVGAAFAIVNGATGSVRDMIWQTAGVSRWTLRANATAEAGANAGSDLELIARSDIGGAIDSPILIARAANGAITFAAGRPVACGGSITHADANALIRTSVALANGAGVGAGNLLNAPVVGSPSKWVPIIDNGVTRYIPAW